MSTQMHKEIPIFPFRHPCMVIMAFPVNGIYVLTKDARNPFPWALCFQGCLMG